MVARAKIIRDQGKQYIKAVCFAPCAWNGYRTGSAQTLCWAASHFFSFRSPVIGLQKSCLV